jgi:hypothetical protein
MWPAFVVLGFFLLAFVIPVSLALGSAWMRARRARTVTCPVEGTAALVELDPWFAARMRALGNSEVRIASCTHWPRECAHECAKQIGQCV